ncbi:MAG: tRNA lysidine(34) synthetase TilS [Clostridiales Family XIII bacterium]|jgi:tRNA(Ile)-lysidine synthase|nr:tRNA lysidine(34) synthetase TilS [Clostridiales Family XIII bacterium]
MIYNAAESVKKTIVRNGLIEKGSHVVAGLSGGPDSVCLFHILAGLRCEMGFALSAVHMNHHLRPGEAEKDAEYAEELCRGLGAGFYGFEKDVSSLASEWGMSEEEAGRIVRYDAFDSAARQIAKAEALPDDKVRVAVAQNRNDQAETVLMRLLRGSGTDGLAAMPYIRHGAGGFDIIRPLLDTDRRWIEAYCAMEKLTPRRDHTNDEAIYRRNRIRLELIPALEKDYNSNIVETLTRLASNAAEDREYFNAITDELLKKHGVLTDDCVSAKAGALAEHDGEKRSVRAGGTLTETGVLTEAGALAEHGGEKRLEFPREIAAGLHPALRHRLIVKCFEHIGLVQDIEAAHLRAADHIIDAAETGKTVEFPGGYRLGRRYDKLVFRRDGGAKNRSGLAPYGGKADRSGINTGGGAGASGSRAESYGGKTGGGVGASGLTSGYVLELSSMLMGETKIIKFEQSGQAVYISCLFRDEWDKNEKAVFAHRRAAVFDYDMLADTADCVEIRSRLPGDWMRPEGMQGRKKLQDMFVDAKLPVEHRDKTALAAVGNEIICILAKGKFYRRTQNYLINEKTKRVFTLEYEIHA